MVNYLRRDVSTIIQQFGQLDVEMDEASRLETTLMDGHNYRHQSDNGLHDLNHGHHTWR